VRIDVAHSVVQRSNGAGNGTYEHGTHAPSVARMALRYRRSASEHVAASGYFMPFD
jgi:hypothetical protein